MEVSTLHRTNEGTSIILTSPLLLVEAVHRLNITSKFWGDVHFYKFESNTPLKTTISEGIRIQDKTTQTDDDCLKATQALTSL